MSDALTNCPKCGFNQPVDQYCANCGVDMLALRKKSDSSISSMVKQPAAIAAIAVVAIVIAFGSSRVLRRTPSDEMRVSELASQTSARGRKENLSGNAPPEIRRSIESKMASPRSESAKPPMPSDAAHLVSAGESAGVSASQAHLHAPGETAAPSLATKAASKQPLKTASNAVAGEGTDVQVAFAWTEVSREWLQAMGASEPGLHRVPDLEDRLRDSKGAYRILEVTKQKIESETTAFAVSHGDRFGERTGLKVEISTVTENGFAGSIQMSYRGPDGGIRAPAAAALAIEKGQGTILTFPPTPPPPGVAPTGAEIVVLILPRWGGDRNP